MESESKVSYHTLRNDRVTTCLGITDYRLCDGLTLGADRLSSFPRAEVISGFDSKSQFPYLPTLPGLSDKHEQLRHRV